MPAKLRLAARINRLIVALLFIGSFFQSSAIHPVHAAVVILTVGTEVDYYPDNPLNTGCFETFPLNGNCSLRAAIAQANQAPGVEYEINFDIREEDPEEPGTFIPKAYPWVFKLNLVNTGDLVDEKEGDLDIYAGTLLLIDGQRSRSDIIIDGTAADNSSLADRVLQVYPTAVVTVQNLTIQNGKTNRIMTVPPGVNVVEYGGGIYNLGSLNLNNVMVQDNSTRIGITLSGGDGGGVYNAGVMNIQGSTLQGNSTGAGGSGTGLTGGSGGAIFNAQTGNLWVTSTEFNGNHTGNGGANYYGGGGGGIYNNGIANISNSIFDANFTGDGSPVAGSGGSGGAINNNASATLYLQVTTFLNNFTGMGAVATGGQRGKGGNGGAISNSGSILNMDTLTFTHNYTGEGGGEGDTGGDGGDGGAIYNSFIMGDGSAAPNPPHLTLVLNQNFTGDGGLGELTGGSGGNGGAIFNDTSGLIRNPLEATFLQNWTGDGGIANNDTGGHGGNGGALYNAGSINNSSITIGIEDSAFTENKAGNGGFLAGSGTSGDGGEGGAIFNRGLIRLINRTTFQSNQAGNGGPITGITSLINGGQGGKGGAILNEGEITRLFESSLNSNLAGNGANGYIAGNGGDGGGVANKGSIDISSSTLFDNSAGNGGNGKGPAGDGGNGGGVAFYDRAPGDPTLRIYNSTISANHSGIAGALVNPGGVTQGFGGDGGGIWVNVGNAFITETTIYLNDVPTGQGHIGHGGGVVNNTPDGYTTIKGSILAGNTVDSTATPSDCFTTNTTLRSTGYNLIGHTAPDNNDPVNKCVAFTTKAPTDPPDYADKPVVLGNLEDNGGPTFTHLPDEDNNPYVIDRLPMSQCTYLTDQRGFPRIGGQACNVGSVEVGAAWFTFLPFLRR